MISSTQPRQDGYVNPIDAEPARMEARTDTPVDPPRRPDPQFWIEPDWKLAHRFQHEKHIHAYGVERLLEERQKEWKRRSKHSRR